MDQYTEVSHVNGMTTIVYENGTVLQGWYPKDLENYLKEKNISREEFSDKMVGSTSSLIGGKSLTYRYDVERFYRLILNNDPTIFD